MNFLFNFLYSTTLVCLLTATVAVQPNHFSDQNFDNFINKLYNRDESEQRHEIKHQNPLEPGTSQNHSSENCDKMTAFERAVFIEQNSRVKITWGCRPEAWPSCQSQTKCCLSSPNTLALFRARSRNSARLFVLHQDLVPFLGYL